jgi:hypothetical protein
MANTDNMHSFIASGTITEFALVAVDSAGKVAVVTDPTSEAAVGIAQRAVAAGDAVDVIIGGLTRAIAGAAIAPETTSLLMASTDGKLIPLVKGSGNVSVARVIPNINHASPADGDQIKVVFTGPSNYAA